MLRGTLYLIESDAIQDPKSRLIDTKCSQNINRKPSVENIVYRLSKSKYNWNT